MSFNNSSRHKNRLMKKNVTGHQEENLGSINSVNKTLGRWFSAEMTLPVKAHLAMPGGVLVCHTVGWGGVGATDLWRVDTRHSAKSLGYPYSKELPGPKCQRYRDWRTLLFPFWHLEAEIPLAWWQGMERMKIKTAMTAECAGHSQSLLDEGCGPAFGPWGAKSSR